jgi:hypothetical protein
MPFDVERLDNAIPGDHAAKQINHGLRSDVLRLAMMHCLDWPLLRVAR